MSRSREAKQRRFIGEIARTVGVSVHTVRYYERLGLLPAIQRTESGYRVYEEAVLQRLRFIHQAQALGFSIGEIREILRLRYSGQSPCACVRRRLRERLSQIENQMRQLRRVRREVRSCLKRAPRLAELPHRASSICPIIQAAPVKPRSAG